MKIVFLRLIKKRQKWDSTKLARFPKTNLRESTFEQSACENFRLQGKSVLWVLSSMLRSRSPESESGVGVGVGNFGKVGVGHFASDYASLQVTEHRFPSLQTSDAHSFVFIPIRLLCGLSVVKLLQRFRVNLSRTAYLHCLFHCLLCIPDVLPVKWLFAKVFSASRCFLCWWIYAKCFQPKRFPVVARSISRCFFFKYCFHVSHEQKSGKIRFGGKIWKLRSY